jgi:hypothetical protein
MAPANLVSLIIKASNNATSNHLTALLRAIATKVIPGLSLATKIVLLQQTAAEVDDHREAPSASHSTLDGGRKEKSALQYMLESDEARNQIQEELASKPFSLPLAPNSNQRHHG